MIRGVAGPTVRPAEQPGRRAGEQFIRFLVAGGLNSVLTYLIYLGWLLVFPYAVAYTAAYVIGIVLSYYLSARFVFRVRPRIAGAIGYPVVYAAQYVLGIMGLHVLVETLRMDERLAPAVVVAALAPVSFLMARLTIARGRRAAERVGSEGVT